MTRIYRGTYKDHFCTVTITDESGETQIHPDTASFDWGYGLDSSGEPFNPGPVALSEALIRDALGEEPTRDQVRKILRQFVHVWPCEQPFEVTDEEIRQALVRGASHDGD